MAEALRTLVLFALAGAAVSVAAWAVAWRMDMRRRLRRGLRRVLEREPDAEIVAPAQARAVGLDLEGEAIAGLWDAGRSGLVWSFEEMDAVELIVDGEVRARVSREEPARRLEHLDPLAERITLRFVFDSARWPEFELDLHEQFGPGEEAVREGRRWLAQMQAVLRRIGRAEGA